MIRQAIILFLFVAPLLGGQFTIGTFNLELYLDAPVGTMKAKPEAAKAKIREALKAMNVDVLAVQEMGSPEAFEQFREALRADGLDYPHAEYVRGSDHALHVAALSRFPIVARRSHTNESYLLNGRRMHVLRGFAEIDIQVGSNYQFTLLTAHLKSKRQSGLSDEEDVREQEAIILREKVDAILSRSTNANVVVLGDLNDHRNSRSIRAVVGRGKNALVDTRPVERNGDIRTVVSAPGGGRQIAWTHYFSAEETYARLDYILLSRGMAREWQADQSYVFTTANWGLASDHRPLVATFSTEDR
jgi:endonuclease/exonuclease/phosphatase family metal-dependent hydrolase